jgi:hypothetical protein
MDDLTAQYICIFVSFLFLCVVAVCNFLSKSDKQSVALTEQHNGSNWRVKIATNIRWISLFSAIAIAICGLGSVHFGLIVSRSSSERLNEQIRNLRQDNDALRTALEPIENFTKTTGLSIQQAITEFYNYRNIEMAQDRQRQAMVAISDFIRLLNNYDTHFKEKSFDSAVGSFVGKGLFDSGIYIKGMIEFAKDCRRIRDNIIDSSIVRLKQLDVNTDTLRFQRKLPIRMGQALKGRAIALGLDVGQLNQVLQCDTL